VINLSTYIEIVTKAVVGKGKKSSKNSYTVQTEETPNTILGCWIINHKFNGVKKGDNVLINGSFDLNIWYSYDSDSKTSVSNKTLTYEDELNMKLNSLEVSNEDIIIKALKQPTVSDVEIKDGNVNLTVEKELGVEVIGDTKVKIAVEDADDDYDEILDLDSDPELDAITDDYIN
jgi:spore coat protein E